MLYTCSEYACERITSNHIPYLYLTMQLTHQQLFHCLRTYVFLQLRADTAVGFQRPHANRSAQHRWPLQVSVAARRTHFPATGRRLNTDLRSVQAAQRARRLPLHIDLHISINMRDKQLTHNLCHFNNLRGSDDITVAICPGIGNTSESVYIRTFVHYSQCHGYRCAVLNHIGALTSVPVTAGRIFTYGRYTYVEPTRA